MTCEQKEIERCINRALDEFNQNEEYLIRNDLSERCICAKFATYIEREIISSSFSGYVVDVEYNRGSHGKEFARKVMNGKNIVVDLIVHKRGYNPYTGFDNLICIEMKKSYKYPNLSSDQDRLKAMTCQYGGFGYKAGYMIVAIANRANEEYKLVIHDAYYKEDDGNCLVE